MKAWLYKDFKWWFGSWLFLFLFSLVLYYHEFSIARMLLNFEGALLVALLTAMAAFDHLNTNEKRIIARNEHTAYANLLTSLDERYQSVMSIRDKFVPLFNLDDFSRGISPPLILLNKDCREIDTDKLVFLVKGFEYSSTEEHLEKSRMSVFNVANIRYLLSNYEFLFLLVRERNSMYLETMKEPCEKNYLGNGRSKLDVESFKIHGVSYASFTNYLKITEQIMKLVDLLYYDYRDAIDELSEHAKKVLVAEIAKEKYGYPKIEYTHDNDGIRYKVISDSQEQYFLLKDFPSKPNYQQRFF